MSAPPTKKRKLPSLDDSFSVEPRPTDSPELHQGRKRTQPHVEGQWAAHVYLDLELEPRLCKVLENAISTYRESSAGTAVHSLLNGNSEVGARTSPTRLHVSLSRPLYLQTNQKIDLCARIGILASSLKSFDVRYATFGVLENDETSRRFLAIEIGQGYQELKDIVRRLDVELESMRLPTYYETPRFHTSIAWTSISPDAEHNLGPNASFLEELDKKYGKQLRRDELWVSELVVKIGKQVTRYKLSGR